MAQTVQNDYPAHETGYGSFVRGVRVSVAVLAALLALLAYFLV